MEVEMIISSTSEGDRIVQKVKALLYERNNKLFYRFREPASEMGEITTTICVEVDKIRLLRQGDISSEQQFCLGKRMQGYYHTAYSRMDLDTVTHELRLDLKLGIGSFNWRYDLYTSGEKLSSHELNVEVTRTAL